MSEDLLSQKVPSFMARTLIPVKLKDLNKENCGKGRTVRNLMAFVYKQVRPMLRAGIDSGKLYFTTQDGFFLPPNA